ncbi:MAG: hypothetical protein A3I05_00920 [Deltaproteobacteria bacterium RIFCSPLOWO2_02_FULL_44_10]|nr:MAG: hypothetical protein A3C46_06595 [Deltaproteobacteria bacterium RIFCSPHIGHO2_02_FULL_44_16]OGQ45317.1 MAG: hypothetical protein A3I05_00920 [Deltaproteobacteria bacterium RIFCSPLOWO2_02_FULL_44_10]
MVYRHFTVSVTIGSDTRYLSFLRDLVKSSARLVGRKAFPRALERPLSLALIEAVNNAIFHAHHGRRSEPIQVMMKIRPKWVAVEVEDSGRGLSRKKLKGRAPHELETHGRGLFLIRQLVDSVQSRRRENRHVLKMMCWKKTHV